MTDNVFRSLQYDLDDRFLETDLRAVERSLAALLTRETGRVGIRNLVSNFAGRLQALVAEVSPKPFEIVAARAGDGVLLSGFPGGETILIPEDDLVTYAACLGWDAKRAQDGGFDMMMLPTCFQNVPAFLVPVATAVALNRKLLDFFD